MNETNEPLDELDNAIDRNLLAAHQQVHFRPEWAKGVLRELASQSGTKQVAVRSHQSWQRAMALAAVLLLAVAGYVWLAAHNGILQTDSKATVASRPPDNLAQDTPPLELNQSATDSSKNTESPTVESVMGGPGYLTSQLSDDVDFEIYVVLPTISTARKR